MHQALANGVNLFGLLTEGAGGSDDPDARGAGMEQLAGTLAGGGAGGQYVIHQQNVAAFDRRARCDLEGSANLLAALFGREGDLRVGKAHAQQRCGLKLKSAAHVLRHLALGVAGDQLSLVEAARAQANLVHGHGNEQERSGVNVAFQLQGGLGGKVSEQAGGDLNALILEEVDELAQGSRVGSVTDGAGEGWRLDGALRAAGIAVAGVFTLEKIST